MISTTMIIIIKKNSFTACRLLVVLYFAFA
jgi:hypothetical protein